MLEEIREHGHVLTPGRHVGAASVDEDDISFPERFDALQAKLEEHFVEADRLAATIRERLATMLLG
jgi:type I restriction enzyme M protein